MDSVTDRGNTTTNAISVGDVQSSGNITVTGTVDGRDVSSDGSKLDGIESGAEVNTVDSVNAQTGAVVLDSDDIAEGNTNLYDKTVTITGTGAATVTGTYPNFTVNATDTDTTYSAGSNISIVGTTINNTAPDQTVTLTEGDNVTITGTYPNFTIASNDVVGAVSSVSAGDGISVNSTTGAVVVTNTITNNNQLTNGAGYTTNVGDITGVTAGTNLTGGGTSGTVTLNLTASPSVTDLFLADQIIHTGDEDTYTQFHDANQWRVVTGGGERLEVNNTQVIVQQDLVVNGGDLILGGTGRIQGIDTVSASTDAANKAYVDNTAAALVTGVTAGAGLDGGGTSGTVTLSIEPDLRGEMYLMGANGSDYYYSATTFHDWFLDGNRDMRLETDGDLHVDGDVIAYSTTTSDRRLKDNIKTIDNALDKVERLRGVEYDWNKGSRKGQHEIGLIAQEVEEVFPFLVKEKVKTTGDFQDDDTAYKSVDYEKLVGVLIESVKELSAKVKTLEAKLQ